MKRLSINFTAPLSAIISNLVKDADFLKDAKDLIGLPEPQYQAILEELDSSTFLNASATEEKINSMIGESTGISRLVSRLDEIVDEYKEDGESRKEALDSIRVLIAARMDKLEPHEREIFSSRISSLVGANGIALQRKAMQLSDHGVALQAIDLICDMRPVFNAEHTRVLGMFPIATLYLEIEGNSKPQMLRVSESMLNGMKTKLDIAVRKMSELRSLTNNLGIPVPTTEE